MKHIRSIFEAYFRHIWSIFEAVGTFWTILKPKQIPRRPPGGPQEVPKRPQEASGDSGTEKAFLRPIIKENGATDHDSSKTGGLGAKNIVFIVFISKIVFWVLFDH